MNPLILVVVEEPDVEAPVPPAVPAGSARQIVNAGDVSLILIRSDINMPGISGLELLIKAKGGSA